MILGAAMNGTTSYSITSCITHYHHFYSASLYIQDGIEEFSLAVGVDIDYTTSLDLFLG